VKPNLPKIVKTLKKMYPRADCALTHANPFQLLIATILSAQCTDERVNKVTPVLFGKFPTPRALGLAPLKDVEDIIRSTGFFHQKALSLVTTARRVTEEYGGRAPRRMEELLTLRGVARKTANVVLGTAYGISAGVVVDTHVRRLSNRLGFTNQSNPVKIEKDLMVVVPKKDWIWISHALITHGRRVCGARNPRCGSCSLAPVCPSAKPAPRP